MSSDIRLGRRPISFFDCNSRSLLYTTNIDYKIQKVSRLFCPTDLLNSLETMRLSFHHALRHWIPNHTANLAEPYEQWLPDTPASIIHIYRKALQSQPKLPEVFTTGWLAPSLKLELTRFLLQVLRHTSQMLAGSCNLLHRCRLLFRSGRNRIDIPCDLLR